MFSKHYSLPLIIGIVLASPYIAGCTVDPAEDEGQPDTAEITSSLSATAPVPWVAVNFHTGNDDKRNDSRVWVRVSLGNGNVSLQEITPGLTWPNWTSTGLQLVPTPSGTRNQDIQSVSVEWQQGGGGWNGDNWNLQSLSIYAWDASYGYILKGASGGNPLRRFTGQVVQYVWPWVQ